MCKFDTIWQIGVFWGVFSAFLISKEVFYVEFPMLIFPENLKTPVFERFWHFFIKIDREFSIKRRA